MKFMKLGSKPDSFQSKGDNVRYVGNELETEIIFIIGNVKFYLQKFPLLSKSGFLQELIANEEKNQIEEIDISDIPGGSVAFEICVKFCYGITVTLNAYNVVSARCAAEYLEMNETFEKSNLIYKIDVFLNSTIFRSWKDSIIVLQTTKDLSSNHLEELKLQLVKRCIDSIASTASIETSKVQWSYTYNRKKKLEKVSKQEAVPKDWWVEDLCDIQIDLYKQIIEAIKKRGKVPNNVIGEALYAYAIRRICGFSKGSMQIIDRYLTETIIELLPDEKGSVSSSFLIKLLRASIFLGCEETVKDRLKKRISEQLEETMVSDLLVFDLDMVQSLVREFMNHNPKTHSKVSVAKLIDGYLAEKSRDPNLLLQNFFSLAETLSTFPRQSHDGLYRAIDMFLKEHPEISKSEKKRVCGLMDCRKLSAEACEHAVQNERLPMRVIVQILFFEQMRTNGSSTGNTTPELTTTTLNTEDDEWDHQKEF